MGATKANRGRKLSVILGLLAVTAGWSAAADTAVSPSAVLTKVDATLGSQYVNLPAGQGDRTDLGVDKTLAPYLYVAGGDSEAERLPLKETSAEVQIAGVIAKVKVRQVFANSGSKPIEAIYVFPASTRAAVHGMRMKIGERTVEAKIEKAQAAREQYQQAREDGKRASLLEQQRPNVFTMNVANIMPGDRIEVQLDYSELLVPEDAVYEFVYPTVVGPRYGGGADPKKDGWIANPYLQEGEKEPYQFNITAHVETGIPLKELSSPSHQVAVNYVSKSSADVRLQQSGGGNKDFVLRYRLAGDQIETGLLTWKGERENFFLMMLEPPQRPTSAQIPPCEYVFLLDVSGSMHGFPLDTAKALMAKLLGQLRPADYFNLALFSGANYVMSPEGSLPATPANIQLGLDLVNRQSGGGGTELMGGLKAVYAVPKKEPGLSRSVVVVTDGFVGVEAQTFKFIREHLNEANVFAFGIGSSVNRGLIEGMARAGQGEPFVVLRPEKAGEQAEKLREYIEKPVLSNIQVEFKDFAAYEVAPAKVPDLMAKRPIVVFGKFRGQPSGRVQVTGYSGGGKWSQGIAVGAESAKAENAPLRWLWARRWVQLLDDELHMAQAKEIEDAITDLGLSYSLLTTFTSFVAIDSQVANRGGKADVVNQPLPLPEGVSNYAVAKSMSGSLGLGSRLGQAPTSSPSEPQAAPEMRRMKVERKLSAEEFDAPVMREPRVMVMDYKSAGLGDTSALVKEIEKQLQRIAKSCAAGQATFKLRLAVDKAGRVTKVEVLEGADRKLETCLAKALTGMSTATKATAGAGTFEMTVKLTAL